MLLASPSAEPTPDHSDDDSRSDAGNGQEEEEETSEDTMCKLEQELFPDARNGIPLDCSGEDVSTQVIGKKSLRGRVYRLKNTADGTNNGEVALYRCFNYGLEYRPGDAVYIESQRPEQPYYICIIQELRMSKRDTLMVHIKWFYRTSEVPELVYQLLVQDRHSEHGNGKKKLDAINDPIVRQRELFISDATDVYPVSVLRGRCTVRHCSDFQSLREFCPKENAFFYTLSYNPETRRLASTQGEIRVGASHQARMPNYEGNLEVNQRPDPEEDLMWSPFRIQDHDLLMYLRAGRSMAAFAAMCDGGSAEDGFVAASRDAITANALDCLHHSAYQADASLQALIRAPLPSSATDVARLWPEDDLKNFIKGLRMYGKNFFKIKDEFIQHRTTADLVEFYYLWKKSPGAVNNRPRGRRHRPNMIRRIKSSKSSTVSSKNSASSTSNRTNGDDASGTPSATDDVSSASDVNDESDATDEISPYYCRHCFTTTSKDWHHACKEKLLLCTDCRIFFKKYGSVPSLEPPKIIKSEIKQEIDDEDDILSPQKVKVPESVVKVENVACMNVQPANPSEGDKAPDEKSSTLPPLDPNPISSSDLTTVTPTNAYVFTGSQNYEKQLLSTKSSIQQTLSAVLTLPNVTVYTEPISIPPPCSVTSSLFNQQPVMTAALNNRSEIQVISPPPLPSPPARHDGSECHRSQSAIFIRQWNRGECNSCCRTDMFFKPVPDSKLCRKRIEKSKKSTCERFDKGEESVFYMSNSKSSRSENLSGFDSVSHVHSGRFSMPMTMPSISIPASYSSPSSTHYISSSFHHMSPRVSTSAATDKEELFRMSVAAAATGSVRPSLPVSSCAPMDVFSMEARRFGHTPNSPIMAAVAAAENRRMEEASVVRALAERQFADRIALSTDPLVRLQMAGVTPEIPPGVFHGSPAFPGSSSLRPPLPGTNIDPRFRASSEDLLGLRYPPGFPPGFGMPCPSTSDILQRQMMIEREHLLASVASQVPAAPYFAQQEEILRLDQEARARHAAAINYPR